MRPGTEEVTRLYGEALRSHLLGGGEEEAFNRANEIGRVAITLRVGVVDLALIHQEALAKVLIEAAPDVRAGLDLRAFEFLAECLAPYEMMLRGYEENNSRLRTSNTELTQANAALAAAHDALKTEVADRERAEAALVHGQKLQAVGLLAGGVAHHFNNLLTVILGNLHLAIRHQKQGEDVEHYLRPAENAASRGAHVVKQLLTFSRQQVLEARAVDLRRLLADLKPLIAGALRGDITVEVETPPDLGAVFIDPEQLELALLNLAVNARDAMPDGGTLRISALNQRVVDPRQGSDKDYVVISVADTGDGIAPEIMSRVFEPFFTTKPLGPGAGLGLSQVHGFILQSGGAIDLESVVGQGTTINLHLPATSEPVAQADDEPLPHTHEDGSTSILVVDDDKEVASLAGELLEGCGYQVQLAHDGKAALDLLNAGEPFDLVFSDIIMPGMNGVQLAEEVRRRFPKLPVLLATGYSDAMPGATAKALPIITKPYDANGLCWRIGELVRTAH